MAKSGTITIAAAGTSQQGPDQLTGRRVLFKAHPDNTQEVYIGGSNAEVSNLIGFALAPSGAAIELCLNNINELWFDANVSTERICWILVD